MKSLVPILFFAICFTLSCNNKKIKPDSLNPIELNQIDNLIEKAIDENSIPGAVVLVSKNNQIIYKKAYGIKNPETNDNYQVDDIFRIASMTKAITSTGIMKLWERGLIGLDDPIENYIPEFENVGILDKFFPKDSTFTIKPTKNKITVRHLLTHTSGLGYGFIDGNPKIKATYAKEKNKFMPGGVLGFSDSDVTIKETIKRMAKMPLHHEPGERFTYAIGIDVLGYLIEIISGETLSKFLEREIFRPLGMKDTYFYLPEEKENRLVPILTKKNQKWSIFDDPRYNVNYPIEGAKKFHSGGGGLSSTVEDYYKFLSIFLNDGTYNSKKIISPSTNQLIQKDQLIKITNNPDSGLGHGLISGIIRESDVLTGAKGSEGTIVWGGYFNTAYFADPDQKIIGIIYKQTQLISEPSSDRFNQIIYGALQKN